MSDRSLDEFASAAGGDGDDAEGEDGSATDDESATDPSRPTMRWSADGAACGDCGTVTSRRWRDGEAFVCADCKEWSATPD